MFSETDRKLIGKRIKSARDFRGYTLNKVALLSNLSASTIQRYETGSFERIKLPTLAAIADALCVSTSWLSLKTEDPGYYDSGNLLEIVASKNGLRNAEALLRYGKNVPAPAETGKRLEETPNYNVIKICGRDGSYSEKRLTDEELAAFAALFSRLPDASDDL